MRKAFSAASLGRQRGGSQPASWWALVQAHWLQHVAVIAMLYLNKASDHWEPFHKSIHFGSDAEYWRYSYPLRPNTVPSWSVPLAVLGVPLLIFSAAYLSGRISRLEAHAAYLQGAGAAVTASLICNMIKLSVGRPRPDFMARCWPDGERPLFSDDGLPQCSPAAINIVEGVKSFPSGHTTWSSVGGVYLTLWLLGFLGCFKGRAHPIRLVVALCPACAALWVGLTRLQDYWHHTEDVACGYALGTLVAFLFYRSIYGPILDRRASGVLLLGAEAGLGRLEASMSVPPLPPPLQSRNDADRVPFAAMSEALGMVGPENRV